MAKIFYAARDRGDFAWRCHLRNRWLYRLRRWQDSPPRISKRTATAEKICRRATTLGDDRAVDRGHCREAWAFASLLLVARDLALLHSASRGRDLPESSHAARGRAVSMGQAWVQRVRRFHRGVESVVALHHRNRIGRNVHNDQYLL